MPTPIRATRLCFFGPVRKHKFMKKFAKDLLVFTINRENKQVLLLKHDKLSDHTLTTSDLVPQKVSKH